MITTKNRYASPLEITRDVKISYNESPAHKGRLKHAVDFIIPEGTPIKAALSGIVIDIKHDSHIGGKLKRFDEHGNYIEIKHRNQEYTIYEHIKKNGALVKEGDKVKTGQVIAHSGATGWLAHLGSHLHFDVHKYFGKNPEDYETLKINWKPR